MHGGISLMQAAMKCCQQQFVCHRRSPVQWMEMKWIDRKGIWMGFWIGISILNFALPEPRPPAARTTKTIHRTAVFFWPARSDGRSRYCPLTHRSPLYLGDQTTAEGFLALDLLTAGTNEFPLARAVQGGAEGRSTVSPQCYRRVAPSGRGPGGVRHRPKSGQVFILSSIFTRRYPYSRSPLILLCTKYRKQSLTELQLS